MPESDHILSTFRFEVTISASEIGATDAAGRVSRAAFSEVTGLEINVEAYTVREGGYNYGVRQLLGKVTHPQLVLKRGVTLDAGFWAWIDAFASARYPLPYVQGQILCHPPGGVPDDTTAAVWEFTNALPTKVKTADLNATSSGEVPIEELHLSHERLWRVR